MKGQILVEVVVYHLRLVRWDTGHVISVTLSPEGEIIDAHCESSGLGMDISESEQRYMMQLLNIEED